MNDERKPMIALIGIVALAGIILITALVMSAIVG